MPDRMPEDMPDRMPEDMPDKTPDSMSDRMPDNMPEDMPDRMPEDMPDRMPEGMPDKVPECLPDRMPKDLPDRMPDRMSEDMPEDMPDRMPEDMPEHMPEDMPVRVPVTKCIDVMVGITRSKVILSRGILDSALAENKGTSAVSIRFLDLLNRTGPGNSLYSNLQLALRVSRAKTLLGSRKKSGTEPTIIGELYWVILLADLLVVFRKSWYAYSNYFGWWCPLGACGSLSLSALS